MKIHSIAMPIDDQAGFVGLSTQPNKILLIDVQAWLFVLLFSFLLVGCKPTKINQPAVETSVQNDTATTLTNVMPTIPQACPKLLRRSLNSTLITYRGSHSERGCDYYFYPNVGENLLATTSDPLLSVKLVAPIMHEFSQGSLKVTQSGRYVIRVDNVIGADSVLTPSTTEYTLKLWIE